MELNYKIFGRRNGAFMNDKKRKIIKFFIATRNFLDLRWQEITLCMLAFILMMQLYPISVRVIKTFSTETSATITDWGLGFGDANTQPRGNVSQKELLNYNSYFIGNNKEKIIYLTFDAGFENGNTATILDILKEEQVEAAFFLVGHYFKTSPDLVKRMAAEGHIVGNHTSSHPDMSKISDIESLKAELEPVEQLYKEITGLEMQKYYRPPQGKFSISNLKQAQELGYKTFFWSLAYVDWNQNSQPDEDFAIKKLNSSIHSGAVVLLHSTSSTNAKILKRLVQHWKTEGYVFKSLNDYKL